MPPKDLLAKKLLISASEAEVLQRESCRLMKTLNADGKLPQPTKFCYTRKDQKISKMIEAGSQNAKIVEASIPRSLVVSRLHLPRHPIVAATGKPLFETELEDFGEHPPVAVYALLKDKSKKKYKHYVATDHGLKRKSVVKDEILVTIGEWNADTGQYAFRDATEAEINNNASLYKREITKDIYDEVILGPSGTFRRVSCTYEQGSWGEKETQVTTMTNLGDYNLLDYFRARKPTTSKLIGYARQCTTITKMYHQKGYYINDLKTENFVIDPKTEIISEIDLGAISTKEVMAMHTEDYSDQEAVGIRSSIGRDTFALGKTFQDFYINNSKKENFHFYALGVLMSRRVPYERVSIELAELWLELVEMSPLFAEAIGEYLRPDIHVSKTDTIQLKVNEISLETSFMVIPEGKPQNDLKKIPPKRTHAEYLNDVCKMHERYQLQKIQDEGMIAKTLERLFSVQCNAPISEERGQDILSILHFLKAKKDSGTPIDIFQLESIACLLNGVRYSTEYLSGDQQNKIPAICDFLELSCDFSKVPNAAAIVNESRLKSFPALALGEHHVKDVLGKLFDEPQRACLLTAAGRYTARHQTESSVRKKMCDLTKEVVNGTHFEKQEDPQKRIPKKFRKNIQKYQETFQIESTLETQKLSEEKKALFVLFDTSSKLSKFQKKLQENTQLSHFAIEVIKTGLQYLDEHKSGNYFGKLAVEKLIDALLTTEKELDRKEDERVTKAIKESYSLWGIFKTSEKSGSRKDFFDKHLSRHVLAVGH